MLVRAGCLTRRLAVVALLFACLALVAACSSSGKSKASHSSATSSNTGSATAAVTKAPALPTAEPAASNSATASASAAAAATLPSSCSAIPTSLLDPYIGSVATTNSLGSPPSGVSCEFANSNASKIIIVNIGPGNAAEFATLETTSGQGGRTVESVSGLGVSAFSISKSGVPGGVDALDSQGVVFSVASNQPLTQDEALIQSLMALF